MRILNRTPFLAGYKVTSRSPPRPEVALVVRGAFVLSPSEPLAVPGGLYPLSQGALTAEVFAEDDAERAGECLYPGDFADFKPRAEVLLRGACHTPSGRPHTECPVRFSVGSWSKALMVVGPRTWVDGAPSEPGSFTRMPLTYDNAFGGPDHPPNPVGKGLSGPALPCVELPARRLASTRDRPPPASFGPVNPAWAARAARLGKEYGKSYRSSRAPFFAEDFDWTHFLAAPPDQWMDGYLRGDEVIGFLNLHPAAASFEKRLPGLRVRAFVHGADGRFREAPMALDTLFADLEAERLHLTWRGLVEVGERDLTDVRSAIVAVEPLSEPPGDPAAYRDDLLAFEADPAFAGLPPATRAALDLVSGKAPGAPSEGMDPVSARLAQGLGGLSAEEQARVRAAMEEALSRQTPEGVDIEALVTTAVNDAARPAPVPAPPAAGGVPRLPIAEALRRAAALADVLEQRGAAPEAVAQVRALLAREDLRKLVPGLGAPGGPPPAPGPGQDLSGQDLTGRDLRGADLRGADLSHAVLSRAQLQGAQLQAATLAGAVLHEADLSDARLDGANLEGASLQRARAAGASFEGATLDRVNAAGAVLAFARLDGARGEGASFEGADLTAARARGASFPGGVFDGATLEDSEWTGARLRAARFIGARAAKVVLERADVAGASFAGADLASARCVEAQGEGSIWTGARIAAIDLRFASLPRAHLAGVEGEGARLHAADLREARLYRASLPRADLSYTDLFRAVLDLADLTGARLASASLYEATLGGARREGADFTGALFRRALVEEA